LAAPVVHDGRVYIGFGQDPEHSAGVGHLRCIDLKRAVEGGARSPDRDVSPELVVRVERRPDGTEKVVTRPNPDSAAAWHYGGEGGDLLVFRHRPGPAVGPDPNDVPRLPFSKMGRVLRRQLHTELEAKVLLRKVELDAMIRTTPCVAGGVLYVATDKTLHAAGVRR